MSLWVCLWGFISMMLIAVGRAAHCGCHHSLAGIPDCISRGRVKWQHVLICLCYNHLLQTSATFTSHPWWTVPLIWEPRQSLQFLLLGYFITATGKEGQTGCSTSKETYKHTCTHAEYVVLGLWGRQVWWPSGGQSDSLLVFITTQSTFLEVMESMTCSKSVQRTESNEWVIPSEVWSPKIVAFCLVSTLSCRSFWAYTLG